MDIAVRKERREGYKTRTGTKDEDDEMQKSHVMFADHCQLLASSRTMLLEMVQSATENIIPCDLERKTSYMQYAGWCSALEEPDLEFIMHGVDYKIPRAQEILVMGSLLSNEADTMSAMRHNMPKRCQHREQTCTSSRILAFLKEGSTRGTNRFYRPACCTRRKHRAGRWSWQTRCMAIRADAEKVKE